IFCVLVGHGRTGDALHQLDEMISELGGDRLTDFAGFERDERLFKLRYRLAFLHHPEIPALAFGGGIDGGLSCERREVLSLRESFLEVRSFGFGFHKDVTGPKFLRRRERAWMRLVI